MRRLRPAHGAAGGDLAGGFHERVLGGGFGAVDGGGKGSVKGVRGLVGGFGGAQVAQWLSRVVLRALFAVFLLYSSQRMLAVQTWVTERLRRTD